MLVHFRQTYIEPNVFFPFSWHFQNRISEAVSAIVTPSDMFTSRYGNDFDLIFNVSAKKYIHDNEIRGPTVFRKTKDVEYTIFLPFTVIMRHTDAPRVALTFLLKGASDVFDMLEIDKGKLLAQQDSLIDGICSDPTMLEDPSWDPEENRLRVRKVFTSFFQRNRGEGVG